MFNIYIFYLIVTLCVVCNCINHYLNVVSSWKKVHKLCVHDSSHSWTIIYVVGFFLNFCNPALKHEHL